MSSLSQSPTSTESPSRLGRFAASFRALRHRNYRLFFSGQLISLVGTWMQSVAQGWLVLRLTDSPLLLGLVAAANSFPVLLLSLTAGSLADRVPKRTILLVTQTVAMLLALTLAFLTLTNLVQIWHVLILALLLGVVNAFDAPARQSFTVEMVGREDLLNAIALNSSMFNMARTFGPALAGVIVAFIGEGIAFLGNGISFVAVIVSLLLMRMPPWEAPRGGKGGQLSEGFAYIARESRVRVLLILVGGMSFFGYVYMPLLPYFARNIFQSGATGLGLLSAASGLGALCAALMLTFTGDKMPRGRAVTIASLIFPPLLITFTLMRSLPLAMLFLFAAGWASVTTMALTNTLIQAIVPDALRGRVMSLFTLSLMGLSPLGGLISGAIAQAVGQVPLVVAGSVAIAWLISITVAVRAPAIREL